MESKIVKTKKLDDNTTMNVRKSVTHERLYIEFVSEQPKLKISRSFQDNFLGRQDAEKFQKSIKSTNDLKAYFKIKE